VGARHDGDELAGLSAPFGANRLVDGCGRAVVQALQYSLSLPLAQAASSSSSDAGRTVLISAPAANECLRRMIVRTRFGVGRTSAPSRITLQGRRSPAPG